MSTVTVVGAANPHNINDHVSEHAAGILATIDGSTGDMGSNNAYLNGERYSPSAPGTPPPLAADGHDKGSTAATSWTTPASPRPCGVAVGWPECAPIASPTRRPNRSSPDPKT
jgi:hypothetical protein